MKNKGKQTLKNLDVELHSLDTFYLFPLFFPYTAFGHYLGELKLNEEREVVFQVNAYGSGDEYATFRARKNGDCFSWESGWMHISVTEEKAEIGRLLVLSHPYTTIGQTLRAEVTVKGLHKSTRLQLEFLAETPSGKFEELSTTDIKDLSTEEEKTLH